MVICFDLSAVKKSMDANPSLETALMIKSRLDLECEKRDWPKPPCILVGCKSDLIEYNIKTHVMDTLVQVPLPCRFSLLLGYGDLFVVILL